MTHAELEDFGAVAYAYRSSPADKPTGVVARFDELVAHVEGLIASRDRQEVYGRHRYGYVLFDEEQFYKNQKLALNPPAAPEGKA